MDAVSYSHSAKQAQRIEKFIENPDSTSGIVTVPKVIEAGESVTVPAGRVAVLPNVQVDGTLNVEGEVFIPNGAGLSTVVQKSGDTMTGNLNFASGIKITGDFSNNVISNRPIIQSSIANGYTALDVVPNGSATSSYFEANNSSDLSNTSRAVLMAEGATVTLRSSATGTGALLPMTFYTSNAERMRIDTGGNVGIGRSSPYSKLHVADGPASATITLGASPTDGYHSIIYQNTNFMDFIANGDQAYRASLGTNNGSGYIRFFTAGFTTGNTERMRIDASGNVLAINSIGLGYGTGSGGTVTQLTSKNTAVTLNKPTGSIITHNESMAQGQTIVFTLNNSLISGVDGIVLRASQIGLNYRVEPTYVASGRVDIAISKVSAGTFSESFTILFNILKGAVA